MAAMRDDIGSTLIMAWGARPSEEILSAAAGGATHGVGTVPHDFDGAPATAFDPTACVAVWPGEHYEMGQRPTKLWPKAMDTWVLESARDWALAQHSANLEVDDLDTFQVSALIRSRENAITRQLALVMALGRDIDRNYGIGTAPGPDADLALLELDRTLLSIENEIAGLDEDEDADEIASLQRSTGFFESCRFLFENDAPAMPLVGSGYDDVALQALYDDALLADLDVVPRQAGDSLTSLVERSEVVLDNVELGLALCVDCALKTEILGVVDAQRRVNAMVRQGVGDRGV